MLGDQKVKPGVDVAHAAAQRRVMFGSGLIGDGVSHDADISSHSRSRPARWPGENGGHAGSAHAV